MRRALLVLAVAVLTSTGAVDAAEPIELHHIALPQGVVSRAVTTNCSGGVIYDDGGFEFGSGFDGDPGMVMRFDLPVGTTDVDQVCMCFTRSAEGPSSSSVELVAYDNDGAGGGPGTLLGSFHYTLDAIPVFPSVAFYSFDLTSTAGFILPDSSIFVGGIWSPNSTFACADTSPGTTPRTLYGSFTGGSSWMDLSPFPDDVGRALGIRVNPATTTTGCTSTATAMCLNNGRFKVEATHQVTGQPLKKAQAVKMTDDTGYLWFFDSTNVEAVVKVLDACGLNNRYWVFAGGLTNVNTVITVTDTLTNTVERYTNPPNTKFQPIQDTDAFATCP